MISLYVSDNCIDVSVIVKTKNGVNVKKHFRENLDKGIVVNGVVLNSEIFVEVINKIKNKIRLNKVYLIIETNLVVQRKLDVPKEIKKDFENYVKLGLHEFQESGKDYYYSFKRKEQYNHAFLQSAVVEKEKIDEYISLFKLLKIKIVSIESANSCFINCLEGKNTISDLLNSTLKNNRYYVVYLCNNILNLSYIENGISMFNIRTRVFADTSNLDAYNEEIISNLLNNFRVQRQTDSFSILAYGLNDIILERLMGLGLDTLNIEEILSSKVPYGEFTCYSSERLNFLESVEKTKKIILTKTNKNVLLFSGVCLIFLLGAVFSIFYLNHNIKIENMQLELEIENLKNSSEYLKKEEILNNITIMNSRIFNMDSILNAYLTNSKVTSEMLSNIVEILNRYSESIRSFYFYRDDDVLRIEGICLNDTMPGVIVKNLRTLNCFTDVFYIDKFEEIIDQDGVRTSKYIYNIECFLPNLLSVSKESDINEIK